MTHRLRLSSGLVLFVFVLGHLTNHALGLVSLDAMNAGMRVTIDPWRTLPGTVVLTGAVVGHVGLSLWSLYRRRNLRLRTWEAAQLILGLAIPLLLGAHFMATRGLYEAYGIRGDYAFEQLALWVAFPKYSLLNAAGLLAVWIHACIGLHTWLRLKPWYEGWRQPALAAAYVLPTLALAGYVSTGLQVRALAGSGDWATRVMTETGFRPDMAGQFIFPGERIIQLAVVGLVGLILLVHLGRHLWLARARTGRLRYWDAGLSYNRTVPMQPGASVLEMLRAAGIPHASVCGGRGRCSTCRVRVGRGAPDLPPPSPDEEKVLARITAPPSVRLACQIWPRADLEITPLLPSTASAQDGFHRPGHLAGEEQEIAILFADIRGFTALAESKLPYDVVFILNRYFAAMGQAVQEAGGRLDKFIGDGVMALFGLDGAPAEGCRQALTAARRIAGKLAELNESLASDLPTPIRVGIGIHVGPVIVGEMGHGTVKGLTAVGDAVNIASRLEGLTKDYGSQLIVSEDVAAAAGIDLGAFATEEVRIRGRLESLQLRLIGSALDLP